MAPLNPLPCSAKSFDCCFLTTLTCSVANQWGREVVTLADTVASYFAGQLCYHWLSCLRRWWWWWWWRRSWWWSTMLCYSSWGWNNNNLYRGPRQITDINYCWWWFWDQFDFLHSPACEDGPVHGAECQVYLQSSLSFTDFVLELNIPPSSLSIIIKVVLL